MLNPRLNLQKLNGFEIIDMALAQLLKQFSLSYRLVQVWDLIVSSSTMSDLTIAKWSSWVSHFSRGGLINLMLLIIQFLSIFVRFVGELRKRGQNYGMSAWVTE